MRTVLIVFGTRPEAVKLAPVIQAARRYGDWRVRTCSTGQHRELLASILPVLRCHPEIELDVMKPGQTLNQLLARLLVALDDVIADERPDMIVAQGDTTTVVATALTSFQSGIAFAHVEAGLRTGDCTAPFPEEGNRRIVTSLASLHLAPTERAASALRREGIDDADIRVTGNTAVDVARHVLTLLPSDGSPPDGDVDLSRWRKRPLVLVTGHRREGVREGLKAVCDAIATLARQFPQVDWVYPVHLNPAVQSLVRSRLGSQANVHCLPPLPYDQTLWLMRRCRFIVTDSGGIQEEAPELGKPVLVTRVSTERPEAVEQGFAQVVGYDGAMIRTWASRWLNDERAYRAACPTYNPFGDGAAAVRCVSALRERLGLSSNECRSVWAEPRVA